MGSIFDPSLFYVVDHSDSLRIKMAHKISSFFFDHSTIRGSVFLRRKISDFLIPPARGWVICPTPYNVKLQVNVDDHIGKIIYRFGGYERLILWFLKEMLNEGDVLLDVGAYIGDVACMASVYVGDRGVVYCVEPVPDHYETLLKNIQINNFNNVVPFNVALGREKSVMNIYMKKESNRGADSLIFTENSMDLGIKTTVTTIDDLIQEQKMRIPDVIKIDVEGFEINVVKGAKKLLRSSEAPVLIVEYNTSVPQISGKARNLYHYIKDVNAYSIYKIPPKEKKLVKIRDENELPEFGNLFCLLEYQVHALVKNRKTRNIIIN